MNMDVHIKWRKGWCGEIWWSPSTWLVFKTVYFFFQFQLELESYSRTRNRNLIKVWNQKWFMQTSWNTERNSEFESNLDWNRNSGSIPKLNHRRFSSYLLCTILIFPFQLLPSTVNLIPFAYFLFKFYLPLPFSSCCYQNIKNLHACRRTDVRKFTTL